MNTEYIRKVQYHETDRMGITHHSNYIKWMEEARISFLDRAGYNYARLEAEGILSPVIGVECQYKHPTTFDDTVRVTVGVEAFKGARFTICYEMVNAHTGALVLTGRTMHCFTGADGRPILLRKKCPELAAIFERMAQERGAQPK